MNDRALPDIIHLSASSLADWETCRRKFSNRYIFGIPPSDDNENSSVGKFVHDILHRIHAEGSCRDTEHVREVLTLHGEDIGGAIHSFVERHQIRCPEAAEAEFHEYQAARFHRPEPPPAFIVTGRLDAVWLYDGLLDVHDYKTGIPYIERVQDDIGARAYAWLLGKRAESKGLRLRIKYEYLAAEVTDDPEPFEPTPEDLVVIEEELLGIASAIRKEKDWAGVATTEICQRCSFRSICPDSASPAEPTWPAASLV